MWNSSFANCRINWGCNIENYQFHRIPVKFGSILLCASRNFAPIRKVCHKCSIWTWTFGLINTFSVQKRNSTRKDNSSNQQWLKTMQKLRETHSPPKKWEFAERKNENKWLYTVLSLRVYAISRLRARKRASKLSSNSKKRQRHEPSQCPSINSLHSFANRKTATLWHG